MGMILVTTLGTSHTNKRIMKLQKKPWKKLRMMKHIKVRLLIIY